MRIVGQAVVGGVLGAVAAAGVNQLVVSDPLWGNALLFGTISGVAWGLFQAVQRWGR